MKKIAYYSLCALSFGISAHAATPDAQLPKKHLQLFKTYCFECHDSLMEEGDVNLEELTFNIGKDLKTAESWQKILNAINSGEMPPEDEKQIDKEVKTAFLDDLSNQLVTARKILSDTGGEITMRRLNRREYRNTIKDLTGAEVDINLLPADGGGGTFDTVGSSQFMSSNQFEQYLKLGRGAIDEMFERQASQHQVAKIFRVEPEKTINVKNLKTIKQLEEKYKLVKPWMDAVDLAVKAPENKEVMEQLRKEHPDIDRSRFRIYRMSKRLKGVPDLKHFGGDPDSAMNFYQLAYDRDLASLKHFAQLPHNDRGTYLKLARGIQRIDVTPPKKNLPPGKYKLRVRAGVVKGSPSERHYIEIGHPQRVNKVPAGLAGNPISSHQVTGTIENPEIIETTVVISGDTPREFSIQERQPSNKKTLINDYYRHKRENGYGTPPAIWVDWVELEGPISETRAPKSRTYRVEPEKTVNVKNVEIIKRLEDTYKKKWLPWKGGVDKAVEAAENREIVAALRKKHPDYDSNPTLKYKKADLLKGAPDPRDYGGSDPINAVAALYSPYRRYHSYMKHYAELPHNDRGAYLKLSRGIQRFDVRPDPKDVPPGTYKLRIRVGAVKGSDPSRHFIEIGHPQKLNGTSPGFAKLLSTQPISGTIENPEIIEVDVEIGASTPREVGIQERQPKSGKLLRQEFDRHKQKNGYGTPPAIWVDWIELEGPITSEATVAKSKVHRVEPEKTINPNNQKQVKEIEKRYAQFTRWKAGVDKAAATPKNKAKIAELRKKHPDIDHKIHFYKYADLLEGTPDPKKFGFRDSQQAASSNPKWDRAQLVYHKHFLTLPHRDRGSYLKLAHGTGRVIVAPKKMPPGNYTLRVRVGAVEGSPASRHFIQVGHPQRVVAARNWGLKGRAISTHQVTGTIKNPEVIEIPLVVGSNTIKEFAIQEKQPNKDDTKVLWDAHKRMKKENGYGHPPAIWIDWVELEGPHSPSQTKVVKQRREVETHANKKVGGTYNGWFKGGYDQAQALLKTGKPQKDIADEAEAKSRIKFYEREGPSYRRYLEDPLTKTGSFLTVHQVNPQEMIALPPEHPSGWQKSKHVVDSLPAGEYKLRFRIGAVEGTSSDRHYVDLGAVPSEKQFNQIGSYQVTGTTAKPQVIEVSVTLAKGGPRKFALRAKGDPKAAEAAYLTAVKESGIGPKPALWVDWVEWEGPLGVSKNESGFTDWWVSNEAGLDEIPRARKILEQFSRRAMRGSEPEADFLDRLVNIFQSRRKAGEKFDIAIRSPLSIILASPGFLYFNEPGGEKERRNLTDRELAVRLSYFLWSSAPDQILLDLAKRKELSKPDILSAQVDRMIADPRSDEFVSGFVHQWLDMERLDFFQFDVNRHRDFDESTRSATRKEVYESFAHLFRGEEEGRLGNLLKSDYVMINSLLANYYGIEGVSGDEFRKVKLPTDSVRGGLLGMAAIHAMGSDGVESSPVERGAWVLRHLLHNPPPPAPPNVPQLSRLADKPLNTRERLAAHMEEPQCASCHRKIDPIGFGMENFNAAGKWRTIERLVPQNKKARRALKGKKTTWKIDPAGKFYKGPEFGSFLEMRDLVAKQEDKFARGFTEHLIEYALGRPFGFTDEDLASGIVASAKSKNYTISEFFQALVATKEFQSK